MSKTTIYKVWGVLEAIGIVTVSRKFGKAKLYMLNEDSEIVKNTKEIEKQLIYKSCRGSRD